MGRYKKREWSGKKQRMLILYEQGLNQPQIAKKLGMNQSNISRVINTDKFKKRAKEFEAKVQDEVMEIFTTSGIQAAKKIVELSKSGDAKKRMQFDAAKEVLYQIGCKPKTVVEETIRKEYTPEEVEKAKQTLAEVEALTERLGRRNSKYIMKKETDEGTE